jgi:hypothetical protein
MRELHRNELHRHDLERLAAFYNTLTEPLLAHALPLNYAADARFVDPFNDVRGLAAIEAVFRHMFRQLPDPRFAVRESMCDGATGLLTWDFTFMLRGRLRTVHGATRVRFDARGLVSEHVDYWDAAGQLYVHFPLVGTLMRALARRLRAAPAP